MTLGGVDTNELSSHHGGAQGAGFYFIGEVMDVTGWLGGYNFQWAVKRLACAQALVEGNLRVRAPWCPDVYDQFNPRKYWAIFEIDN